MFAASLVPLAALAARTFGVGGLGLGANPVAALTGHASGAALAAVGDLAFTGPTGTNVNDLKIGLVAG